MKDDAAQGEATLREVVVALHALFPSHELPERRPQFPAKAQVALRTLAGTFEEARNLYISSAYGPRGRVLQDLYGSFAPEKLLAPPDAQGLSGSGESLVEFFRWLGVANAPRDVRVKRVENGFLDHVRSKLPSPLVMEDYDWAHGFEQTTFC